LLAFTQEKDIFISATLTVASPRSGVTAVSGQVGEDLPSWRGPLQPQQLTAETLREIMAKITYIQVDGGVRIIAVDNDTSVM
jgi:hypothetical protein